MHLKLGIWILIVLFILLFAWRWSEFQELGQRAKEHALKYLTRAVPLKRIRVKTGDLILFSNENTQGMRRYMNNGFFTHIGIVYQDPSDGVLYILESNLEKNRIQNPFVERIQFYQQFNSNRTDGTPAKIAVRRLSRPMQTWQLQALHSAVEQMSDLIVRNSMNVKDEQEDSTGAMSDLITNAYLPGGYNCLMAHVFEEQLPVEHRANMLCTDFVAYLLQEAMILRKDIPGRCMLVQWFQTHQINDNLLLPDAYWYNDELIYIKP